MIIPRPTYTEPAPSDTPNGVTEGQAERIRQYMDCENWTCLKCGAVMFGRMKYCVYCKFKLNVLVLRGQTEWVTDS
jgi:uncharacterized OB-fold protein